MTQQERKQLNDVIAQLELARANAPVATTYRQGKTENSVATDIAGAIRMLQAMVDDE